jgi:hypothetical protein
MRDGAEQHGIPASYQPRIEFSESGLERTYTTRRRLHPEMLLGIEARERLISERPLAAALETIWQADWFRKLVRTDGQGRPISETSFDEVKWDHFNFLVMLVGEFVSANGSLDATAGEIGAFLSSQRERWTSPTIPYEAFAPVSGLKYAGGSIGLDSTISLVAFSGADRSALLESFREFGRWASLDEIAESHFRIIGRESYKRGGQPTIGPRVDEATWGAITAMRLMRSGGVSANVFIERHLDSLSGGSASGELTELRAAEHMHAPYVLREEDLPELLTLYRHVMSVRSRASSGTVVLALRRFNLSYTRQFPEDRLIDLAIALEATLLYGIRDELRYRVALRGAALLRKHASPSVTFGVLLDMYDLRSTVVHDGRLLRDLSPRKRGRASPIDAEYFVVEATDLVRSVLRRYVERIATGESMDSITKALDGDVTTGLGVLE